MSTFRSVSTVASSSTTPMSIPAPAGLAEFDNILLQVSTNSAGAITPPSGFTLVDEITGLFNLHIYKKTATASEPGSYSVGHGTDDCALAMVAWTPGSGKTLVVDAHANQTNASNANRVCPSVTTTRANDVLLCFFSLDGGANSTPDAAMTERWDYGLTIRMYMMTQIVSGAGATGTRTATGTAQASKCVTVALYETDPPVGDPSSLSATAVSASQINLAWLDNTSNETGFEIERSADGSTGWTLINTTAANATSYSNTGLSEHATWYYRVRAVNADGATGYTSVQNATTQIIAPTGLTATATLSTKITLTWAQTSTVEDGFSIEQSNNGSTGWSVINTTAANVTSYSVTGLAASTTRYFRVRAYVGSDFSAYTSVANATTYAALVAPTTLAATGTNPTTVRLTWHDLLNSSVSGYSVERDSGMGFAEVATPSSPPYTDSGLDENTTYTYRVRAYRSGSVEYSSYSSSVSIVTTIQPRTVASSYLFLLAPETVYTARVNMATVQYPLDAVAFDGGAGVLADVREGMTIVFGSAAGLSDLGRQRVRKLPADGTFYIGRSSRGAHDGEVNLSDNAYITVLDDYRVWAKIEYIAPNGTIFKDSDLAVGSFTTTPPPVSNCGPGFADTINSITNFIQVQFTSTSFATATGATITAYLWDIADGSVTAGGVTTSTVTATFPAGFRWVHLTVTDSNGKTHTSHCPVYARDPDPFVDDSIRNFQITGHTIKPSGQEMQLNVRQDISAYPDGTLAMVWAGSASSPTDRSNVLLIGWHDTDPATIKAQRTGLLRDVTLSIIDVAGRLDRLPAFSQVLEHHSPVRTDPKYQWTDFANPNLDLFVHYILQWQSTGLDLADFQWSGTGSTYKAFVIGIDATSLYDGANKRCQAFIPDRMLTCNRRGQLAMPVDPMLQNTADRTAIVHVALYPQDYSSIQYTNKYFPTVHWINGWADLAINTAVTPLRCKAPGSAPGQGIEEQDCNYQIAVSQTALNDRTGHHYARLNKPIPELRITLAYGDDRDIEPADLTWVNLYLTSAVAAQRGLTFDNARGLVKELSIRYDYQRTGYLRTVDLVWEPESVGYTASTVVLDTTSPIDSGGWTPAPAPAPAELPHGIASGVEKIAMIDNHMQIVKTANFQSSPPTWSIYTGLFADTSIDNFGGDPLHSAIVDPFSPLYRSTGTTVRAFAVNKKGIWRIDDIFGAAGSPTKTRIYTFANYTYVQHRTIMASFGRYFSTESDNPWLMVASTYKSSGLSDYDGVMTVYSKDAGATWSSEVSVASGIDTSGSHDVLMRAGLYLSPKTPGLAYTAAFTSDGNPATGAGYSTTDWGETWAALSAPSMTPGNDVAGTIHVPYPDNDNEDQAYYGKLTRSGSVYNYFAMRSNGASTSDISPTSGGKSYGPWRYPFGIRTYDGDRTFVAMAGRANGVDNVSEGTQTHGKAAVFVSDDEGATWTEIIAPMNANTNDTYPDQVAFSGDDSDAFLIWGNQFYIAYTTDFGGSVEDKYGNIGSIASGEEEVVLLCGGDS